MMSEKALLESIEILEKEFDPDDNDARYNEGYIEGLKAAAGPGYKKKEVK
jgi:hypothetical protein